MCMRIWEQSVCVVMFVRSCVIVVCVNLDILYLIIFKVMLVYIMLLTLIIYSPLYTARICYAYDIFNKKIGKRPYQKEFEKELRMQCKIEFPNQLLPTIVMIKTTKA